MQSLWKIVWFFLRKWKWNFHMTWQFHSWVYIQLRIKALIWKDTYTSMFISVLFSIAKTWEQPKCPSTEKWIKKMWCVYIYIYTHNGISLSHEKNENLPFAATWMDLESIMLSKVSQIEKDKYCMISLICAI